MILTGTCGPPAWRTGRLREGGYGAYAHRPGPNMGVGWFQDQTWFVTWVRNPEPNTAPRPAPHCAHTGRRTCGFGNGPAWARFFTTRNSKGTKLPCDCATMGKLVLDVGAFGQRNRSLRYEGEAEKRNPKNMCQLGYMAPSRVPG